MLFTYEIALRNEKGDVLRNFGGSFVTNGHRLYLLISDLIHFASDLSEQANKADNSAMVPCLAYKERFKICDHAVVFCKDSSDSCLNKAQHQ